MTPPKTRRARGGDHDYFDCVPELLDAPGEARDYGTEAGGTRADEFCTHCYQGGAFTAPEVTMDQMADIVAGFIEGMPRAEATQAALTGLSGLKRWRGD